MTVHELRLEEFHPGPEAWGRLVVGCSSGTYVRTICADLGEVAKYGIVSNEHYRLMWRLLPGPYTIILEATRLTPRTATALATVAPGGATRWRF